MTRKKSKMKQKLLKMKNKRNQKPNLNSCLYSWMVGYRNYNQVCPFCLPVKYYTTIDIFSVVSVFVVSFIIFLFNIFRDKETNKILLWHGTENFLPRQYFFLSCSLSFMQAFYFSRYIFFQIFIPYGKCFTWKDEENINIILKFKGKLRTTNRLTVS